VCPPAFDFALDSLSIDGNIGGSGNPDGAADFFDDFADGSLTVSPTSEFFCESPVNESGGFLNFESADGAGTEPPQIFDLCTLDSETGTSFQLQDGAGDSEIVASFRADVPLEDQAYVLALDSEGEDFFMGVLGLPTGPVVTGTFDGDSTGGEAERVPVDLIETEIIQMKLAFDDGTNELTASFSTDGGSTFTDLVFPQPVTMMTTDSEALVLVGAFSGGILEAVTYTFGGTLELSDRDSDGIDGVGLVGAEVSLTITTELAATPSPTGGDPEHRSRYNILNASLRIAGSSGGVADGDFSVLDPNDRPLRIDNDDLNVFGSLVDRIRLGGAGRNLFQITESSVIRRFNFPFPTTTWDTHTSLPTEFGEEPLTSDVRVRTNGQDDRYRLVLPFSATVRKEIED